MIANGGNFADRKDAGRRLAEAIAQCHLEKPVVLALPRGGVPVAFEVARKIGAPLDILLVRKIGAPGHEEYGIGAVVDGASPQIVIDEHAARLVGASRAYIERQATLELQEIERRRAAYHTGPPVSLSGRTIVLVDDGIATGGTVRAALRGLARTGAGKVVLAVPLAPAEVLPEMRALCDEVVCLESPQPFHAVGAHYRNFTQTTDEEVIRLLEAARGPIED